MAIITYKTYHFQAPALIDEAVYSKLKQASSSQPHFQIYQPQESFTAQFKRTLYTSLFVFPPFAAVLGFMLYHGVPPKPLPGWWVALIVVLLVSGFMSVLMLAHLLLEGPSYATYLHHKQLYYTAMQHAISTSQDYPAFVLLFFGPTANRTVRYEKLALQAPLIPPPPGVLNRVLIRLFRTIAGMGWMVIVALLAWWLWKRYAK